MNKRSLGIQKVYRETKRPLRDKKAIVESKRPLWRFCFPNGIFVSIMVFFLLKSLISVMAFLSPRYPLVSLIAFCFKFNFLRVCNTSYYESATTTIIYGTVQLQLHTRVICHAWYHALFSVKRKFVTRDTFFDLACGEK